MVNAVANKAPIYTVMQKLRTRCPFQIVQFLQIAVQGDSGYGNGECLRGYGRFVIVTSTSKLMQWSLSSRSKVDSDVLVD